jgi:hypothetical protein
VKSVEFRKFSDTGLTPRRASRHFVKRRNSSIFPTEN